MAVDERDEELMVRVARGDGAALATLVGRWQEPLHRLLWRQTGGRDADDLFQETWLRVVRAADRFDPSRRFSTWLFQIALNLARDWQRRRPPEPVDPTTIETAAPDGAATRDAALDAQRLLAALPDGQRLVVALRVQEDLDEGEVARILGIPRGTVKSRLHQAMRTLAARVRGERA